MFKVFNKILLRKLTPTIGHKIKFEQSAFHAQYSTTLQSNSPTNSATTPTTGKNGFHLPGHKKAVDRVWHDGLIYKLHHFGAPVQLLKSAISFFNNRSFRVETYSPKTDPCSPEYLKFPAFPSIIPPTIFHSRPRPQSYFLQKTPCSLQRTETLLGW